MASGTPSAVSVIDFRRQTMVLEWHPLDGTWIPCDVPPALVHGVAQIRASQPNICLFGWGGDLHLQIGSERYALSEDGPRIECFATWASFGLRKRFVVKSNSGGSLFSHGYWAGQGEDFFSWLASRASDAGWREANGPRWSSGVEAAVLRSS